MLCLKGLRTFLLRATDTVTGADIDDATWSTTVAEVSRLFTQHAARRIGWYAIYAHDYDAADESTFCAENGTSQASHLHIVYNHFNGNPISNLLGSFAAGRRLGFRWSKIRQPWPYWKYLRQGAGRRCLYEKGAPNRPVSEQINGQHHSEGEENAPVQHGLEPSDDAEINDATSDSIEYDQGGNPRKRTRLDENYVKLGQQKRLSQLGFQGGIKRIFQAWPVLDVQQLREFKAKFGDAEIEEWWDRFKHTNKFEQKVELEIMDLRADHRHLP